MKKIPFLKPNLVKKEQYLPYLSQIDETRLYSNFGPLNTLLERRIIDEMFDSRGAAATVNNATTGLILAISLLMRPGARYALMPSFTFPATPLAAMWCGLEPYFVDIREDDWCMDETLLADLARRLGNEVSIIVPYATFGANMDLSLYRRQHGTGVPVVVDAAASFGSTNDGRQFGVDFPSAVVFSFHATKAFGIGEGGLVYSADLDFISRLRQAENFGFSNTRECELGGLNGKMPEVSAAIALATLDVYPSKVRRRQQLHGLYREALEREGFPEREWVMQRPRGIVPSQFMTVLCPSGQSNLDYVEKLAGMGIDARTYFSPPCHQQRRFSDAPRTSMAVTERISRRILSLPFWEEMGEDDVGRVIEGLTAR